MSRSIIIHKNPKLRTQREQGQAFVIIALALVVLMVAVGLATDATLLYKTKQDLQRTVDSAALAAAYKLPNQINAEKSAYEFARLHGYDFNPASPDPLKHLVINYPTYNPPRKAISVKGSTNVNFAFLSIIGIRSTQVSAVGEAEGAPLDVYLIFDLSESMVYDLVTKPSPWPTSWPTGFPTCTSSQWDPYPDYADCVAKYCNAFRKCDPLDLHIKPAAKFFVDKLDPQYDRVGVVSYNQSGTKVLGLTNDFTAVKAAIDSLRAFDHQEPTTPPTCDITRSPSYTDKACNKQTNIGDGIMMAHDSIAAEGRKDAIWSMILMTDGKANVYRQDSGCTGCPPNCGTGCTYVHLCDECQSAIDWAIKNAKDTWTRHEAVIYTIAYGTRAPGFEDLMIDIADWTDNGLLDGSTTATKGNFWAAPTETELRIAFTQIAERIYSRLLR